MPDEITTKGIPHKKLAPIIDKLRAIVLNHSVVKDVFEKYDLSPEEAKYMPICFAKIPVSARTDHGVIYINVDLILSILKDGDFDNLKDIDLSEIEHYLAHETTHYVQQTTGDKATPCVPDGSYLDNPIEQEGFQNQTKYISDTQGDDAAEEYVDKVLDHHDETNDEDDTDDEEKIREKRRKKLLDLADEVNG